MIADDSENLCLAGLSPLAHRLQHRPQRPQQKPHVKSFQHFILQKMDQILKKIDCFCLTVRLTATAFAKHIIFWLLALSVAAGLEFLHIIALPKNWFSPAALLIATLFVAAATFVLEADIVTRKKGFTSRLGKAYCWMIRSCNKSIGSVGINSAAITLLMLYLAPSQIQNGWQAVAACLAIGWFDCVLQQRSLARAQMMAA